MSSHHHHRSATPINCQCYVLTISDTRSSENDQSGQYILKTLEASEHSIAGYQILKDEPTEIQALFSSLENTAGIDVILLNGGTGISPRDRTYEALEGLLEKKLDGFGEIFRFLSYQEIGSAAMLSRAIAGIWKGRILFSMPGSTPAVQLAMERLILPELGHLVSELRKSGHPS